MNKILIITHEFLPDLGGGLVVAYDYANLLVEMGYEVTVLSKEYPNPLQNTKFELLQVPNKYGNKFWLFNYGSYFKNHSLDQYNKIILNQSSSAIVAGKYFKNEDLAKSIVLIQGHEVEWVYQNKKLFSKIFNTFLLRTRYYHKKALINCRKIVSVSCAHLNKVIKATRLEKYREKFQVVYTGIDKDIFYPVTSDFRAKNNLTEKETILISVSRIEKMKGYLSMLSVFEELISKNKTFRWVIIGDGPFLNGLRDIISKKNLSKYIILLGRVEREKLNYYYSAADCFWLLSDYDETFGLVYLEAQACGIPVIGRNKGGVVESIVNNKTGFLVSSEKECLPILLNKEYEKLKKEDLFDFVQGFDKIKATKDLIS